MFVFGISYFPLGAGVKRISYLVPSTPLRAGFRPGGVGGLSLIGPSTWFDFAHHRSLRVEQSSSFGFDWVCFEQCSLLIVRCFLA